MITSVLIANRGEIACRIMRTAQRLGIRTIAVYSEADAQAAHVAMADEAYPIGPAPARESYLRIDAILAAADLSGADAIHPGYGFLSENAAFADACAAAGVVFIGPPASAIQAMGSKSAAKALMERAGVPLVPGYHGEAQDPVRLLAEAERIGFPVLIKASAGGGGKGMRIVNAAGELAEALAGAQREAQSSFGDPRVLIEKYLDRPRHIEVQIFADRHGGVVHLFERDCSIQRRYQKVIEEAPAPGMDEDRRAAITQAAIEAARAVGYVGAGTVEFIADADGFYFMEMNTRLQVEHPVTEAITGQDLVEWQIRVAAGEPLPVDQEDLAIRGHAIEARLYAEDPNRDFLPQGGRLHHLRLPYGLPDIRVDAGVRPGDTVPIHYDPMIAKLIGWGPTRAAALARLRQALSETQVVGLATNRAFLGAIAAHPAFAAAELDTGFIERYRADLMPDAGEIDTRTLALATLALLLAERRAATERAARTHDPWSPWGLSTGWRMNRDARHEIRLADGETEITVVAHFRRSGFLLDLPNGTIFADGELAADGALTASLDGARLQAIAIRQGDAITLFHGAVQRRLVVLDLLAAAAREEGLAGRLTAPMPGKVVAVLVKAGDKVARGAALMIVEAMKMEHTIAAPADGTVARVGFAPGDLVEEGAELLVMEETA